MNSLPNNTTNITFPSLAYKAPAFRIYIALGFMAILANLVNCAVFVSDRKLLRKSALLFGVTCTHLISGVHLVWAGLYRLVNIDTLGYPRHPWKCVLMIFPDLYPFMFQSLATLLLIGGIERLMAFAIPTWFYTKYTKKNAWCLVVGAYIFTFISVLCSIYTPWSIPDTDPQATFDCVQPYVYGKSYVSFYLSFSVVCGTLAVLVTIYALKLGIHHISSAPLSGGNIARTKRQIRLTKIMLIICTMDFVLVVIPNAILLFSNLTSVPPQVANYATMAYGVNAVVMVFANFIFNSEFRKAAMVLMGKNGNSVTPVQPIQAESAANKSTRT